MAEDQRCELHSLLAFGSDSELSDWSKKFPVINVNHADDQGRTCLHLACYRGCTELARYLINQCKANVNVVDNYCLTPLHWSAFHGNYELVKLLIANEAEHKPLDTNCLSPIDLASVNNHEDVIDYLAEVDIDKEIKTRLGITCDQLRSYDASSNDSIKDRLVKYGYYKISRTVVKKNWHVQYKWNPFYAIKKQFIYFGNVLGEWDCKEIILSRATILRHFQIVAYILKDKTFVCWTDGRRTFFSNLPNVNKEEIDAFALSLIKRNKSVNILHWAAAFCSESILKLIQIKNPTDSFRMHPLHIAAAYGNCAAIEYFIDQRGINPDIRNEGGDPPLYFAILNERLDAVRLLYDRGAFSYAAISWAIDSESILMIDEVLLHDDTPLTLEQIRQTRMPNVFQHLLPKVVIDAEEMYLNCVIYGLKDEVEALLDTKQVDVNCFCREKYGCNILILAVQSKSIELVDLLLKRGYNIEWKEMPIEYSPLFYAIRGGHVEIARLLVKNCRNIKCLDSDNYPSLVEAVIYNEFDIVKLLVMAGADVNATFEHSSILGHAMARGHHHIVDYLLKKGAKKESYIHIVAAYGSAFDLEKWLQWGTTDVNEESVDGITPLISAVRGKNIDTTRLLLKHGANVNIRKEYGETALFDAFGEDNYNLIEILLKHGADVNVVSTQLSYTPLIKALWYNSDLDVIRLLLDYGADVNVKTTDGSTPLSKAIGNGFSLDYLKLMIIYGAKAHFIKEMYSNNFKRLLTILKLLHLCGLKYSDIPKWLKRQRLNRLLRMYIQQIQKEPLTLQQLTRISIRDFMGRNYQKILKYDRLPTYVQKYLAYEIVFD